MGGLVANAGERLIAGALRSVNRTAKGDPGNGVRLG